MFRKLAAFAPASLIFLTACGSGTSKPVESVGGTYDVSPFVLRSLKGTRDGEPFEVHAFYGDGLAKSECVFTSTSHRPHGSHQDHP
jgi:hypothetical protein